VSLSQDAAEQPIAADAQMSLPVMIKVLCAPLNRSVGRLSSDSMRRWTGRLNWSIIRKEGGLPMRDVLQNEGPVRNMAADLGAAALISLLLVLPFAILESLNQTINRQNAPGLILLFGVLWLLPVAFIVVLVPLVRAVRAGNSLLAHPITFLFKVAILVFIAWFWGSLFIDQLPCFMGVPNCD
jgi:hypothetical protein